MTDINKIFACEYEFYVCHLVIITDKERQTCQRCGGNSHLKDNTLAKGK